MASAPLAEPSPYGHGHGLVVTWGEVLHQTVARLANINPEFKLRVVDSEDAQVTCTSLCCAVISRAFAGQQPC